MTDKTKQFLTELSDLLDRYDGGLNISLRDGVAKLSVWCEKDTYITLSNNTRDGEFTETLPQEIKNITR